MMGVRVPLSTSRVNVSGHLSKVGRIWPVSLTLRVFPPLYMNIKPGRHNNISLQKTYLKPITSVSVYHGQLINDETYVFWFLLMYILSF